MNCLITPATRRAIGPISGDRGTWVICQGPWQRGKHSFPLAGIDISVYVEDAGAFTTPYRAIQRWLRRENTTLPTEPCAENNDDKFNEGIVPLAEASRRLVDLVDLCRLGGESHGSGGRAGRSRLPAGRGRRGGRDHAKNQQDGTGAGDD